MKLSVGKSKGCNDFLVDFGLDDERWWCSVDSDDRAEIQRVEAVTIVRCGWIGGRHPLSCWLHEVVPKRVLKCIRKREGVAEGYMTRQELRIHVQDGVIVREGLEASSERRTFVDLMLRNRERRVMFGVGFAHVVRSEYVGDVLDREQKDATLPQSTKPSLTQH